MKAELIAERVGHNDAGALIYRRYRHLFRTSRCANHAEICAEPIAVG